MLLQLQVWSLYLLQESGSTVSWDPASLWKQMGPLAKGVVILMILMSVYSLWVMIERLVLFTQAKNQSLKLLGALSNVLTRGDYQQAIDITKKYKQSHLAKVIAAGLLEFEAVRRDKRHIDPEIPLEAARQGMDRTAMITVAELKENLGVLATIGATAPFVGLFVAIPAVWAYNYFQNRIDRFTVEMSNSGSEMAIYFMKEVGIGNEKAVG